MKTTYSENLALVINWRKSRKGESQATHTQQKSDVETRVTRARSARKTNYLTRWHMQGGPSAGKGFLAVRFVSNNFNTLTRKKPNLKRKSRELAINKYKRYNFCITIWGLWYGRTALCSFRRFRRNSQLFSKWLDDFLFTYNLLHFTLRAEVKSFASHANRVVGW